MFRSVAPAARAFTALGAITTLATLAAIGAAPASAAETVQLNLRDVRNESPTQTPAQSIAPLTAGQAYVLTVSGTGSIWPGTSWGVQGTCGVAEARPITPSPGAVPTQAGWDAATLFAAPTGAKLGSLGRACQGIAVPLGAGSNVYSGFEYATGASYTRVAPYGGFRSVPRSDHTYSYQVTGEGNPIRFRFFDKPAVDNSGILTITIRTAAECAAENCLAQAGTAFDQVAPPVVTASPDSIRVTGTRTCKGVQLKRKLTVRVKPPHSTRFKKVVYFLNGKKKLVVAKAIRNKKPGRVLPAVKFTKLSSHTVKLRIDATTTVGQKITVRKTIGRCAIGKKAKTITF